MSVRTCSVSAMTNTPETWESVHLEETTTYWNERKWRIRISWRQVLAHGRPGHIFPAGVAFESLAVPWGQIIETAGSESLNRNRLVTAATTTRGRPPEVSSDLISNRVRWGAVLKDHREQLEQKLRARGERLLAHTPPTGSPASRLGNDLIEMADHPYANRRADDRLYRRVAELYRDAEKNDPDRTNLRVLLELVNQDHWHLDPGDKSDRQKVRGWVRKARDLKYLPEVEHPRKSENNG